MAEYKKFARTGSFKKHTPSGGGQAFKKELYDAECANCHKRCQVPFRPNGKKPVHCADCFVKDEKRAPSRYGSDDRKFSPRPTHSTPAPAIDGQVQDLSKQIKVMNETLERLAVAVESLNRSTEFSAEVRKHLPVEAAEAPVKKATKVVKKK
ncbi:MAG TPA: CxxC-x17-CxxC domain-containing protein [Candidatus Paceibacterota bacterium]|nr:CxxC-x17-CxxC domain-containing protein [Candidatus Paceibacterota bacterium]